MRPNITALLVLTGLTLALWIIAMPVTASAQEPDLIGNYRDWAAYSVGKGGSKMCYAATSPKDMKPKGVRRGDVFFLVTHQPGNDVIGEVSIDTGYPYKKGARITGKIGKTTYVLFGQEQRAWLEDAEADRKMIKSLKGGTTLIVTGTSTRGTVTTDRYSLIGFSAAYKAATKACNVR